MQQQCAFFLPLAGRVCDAHKHWTQGQQTDWHNCSDRWVRMHTCQLLELSIGPLAIGVPHTYPGILWYPPH